jgi:hypothetical protein
MGCPW